MQNRIKKLREQKHITQTVLAVEVGCSQNVISKIENGKCDPKSSILAEIADYFNVSVDYILGRTKNRYLYETYLGNREKLELYREYVNAYAQLSEESRNVVDTLVLHLAELEKNQREEQKEKEKRT